LVTSTNHRYRLRQLEHRAGRRRSAGDDHVGAAADELLCAGANAARVGGAEVEIEREIMAFYPIKPMKPFPQAFHARLAHRIVLGSIDQHADAPHPFGVLGPRGARKHGHAA
jgi:hypothetical protein